ncbi:MAG TPA: hypothetical protein VM101_07510, partial [Flavitalea sp.]|nr:hypothetical protein [Flavitalea sp.]
MYDAPNGEVTVIEPLGSKQVGDVVVADTVGAPDGVLMVAEAVVWHAPAALLIAVMVYDPAPSPLNVGDDWKLVPSTEYVYSLPSGAVTVMLPVGVAQVGCVAVVLICGAPIGLLRFTFTDAWQDPAALLITVMVYDPALSPLNIGDVWKLVPSIEYVYSAPSGAVTVIEPAVGFAHVGSVEVVVTVGAFAGALI